MRSFRSPSLLLCALIASAAVAQTAPATKPPAPLASPAVILPGRYEGALDVGGGKTMAIVLRLLEGGGGLVDMPGQKLYGYPLSGLAIQGPRIAFTLGGTNPDGSDSSLRFDALVKDPLASPLRLDGTFSKGGASGSFYLFATPKPAGIDRPYSVRVKGGYLRGSLVVPPGAGPFPLVVIVGGAGTTDRDGNNYSVPGKNDGIKALAYALRDLGVSTYRYDKRGAGESYLLAGKEEDQRFGDYVEDAMAAFSALRGDKSFSRVVLLGHTEGGLVAAAAGRRLQAAGLAVDGLALLCTTGKTAVETFQSGLSEVPEEYKAEAAAIMDSLRAGKPYPSPSAYFAEFFRPSFQPYLMSWFKYDIKAELKAWKGPILLVQGNQDFQVSLAEFTILAAARPDAAAFVLPAMNHVLKDVPPDLDENYASFSDPSFPLADRLAAVVAAFAKGGALPGGLPRMDGGVVRNQ